MQVISVLPAANSTGRPLEENIQVTFDREVNQTTIDAGSFVVAKRTLVGLEDLLLQDTVTASTAVDGVFSFQVAAGRTTVTFNPSQPLEPNSEYTVILSQDIKAVDGTSLAGIYQWKFTTGSGAIIEPPTDTSGPAVTPYHSSPVTPLTGGEDRYLTLIHAVPPLRATNLPLTTNVITLTFNKALDPDQFSTASCSLLAEPVDGRPDTPAAGPLQFAAAVVDGIKLRLSINLSATPLRANNLVSLRIESLWAADGSPLAAPLEYSFTTIYSPLYSSARLVRSMVGSYIGNIPDDTINLAIYAASQEADRLALPPADADPAFVSHLGYLKSRYALVSASLTVLLNSDNFGFRRKSKIISDLEVSWEQSRIMERLYEDLRKEQQELETELSNLGGAHLTPQMAVKGNMDFDRPLVGRGFVSSPFEAPAVNDFVVSPYSRRKLGAWNPWPSRPRRVR